MSDTKAIPAYRCTSCLQPFPADKDQHLIGQVALRPESDDAHNFIAEAQNLIRYANAVAVTAGDAKNISEHFLDDLLQLIDELTEEAHRRLERAQEALEIVWER